ncbi:MAG: RpiR family transcriptional regulator [Microbacterium sp. SCN 70-200]|uniref:MurR/RpiR family transcriptional regulator n=1 Tax=unclassified Microbacterium TaxID=2609290 RepID=UPI0008691244|nr:MULTISPECIES: MurR/RpiR family transcriptional regulator [unclassified Microbacterium]MBN9215590.1 MurR/RpiR family transcriptional regulator [Microbacterium sp.]ODT41213.1 MAG: RpiR family transcriptional regulator [Microbacterium sp. SCN 70-200]OJV79391.1 MAG: RpiR family transcriptional regulator [Microbacterium sp. 70-16]
MWTGSADAPPTARIAMLAPSLQPSEQRVAESIAADVEAAIDRTAQEVADLVGVGRASVIRTAQSLGYDGYPQLRVALAREVAMATPAAETVADGTMLGELRGAVERFSGRLMHTVSALTEDDLVGFVRVLDASQRVLVAANGLSSPLGLDLAMRLISAGRPAEYLPDTLGQQIAATQLGAGSACLVVSGSGANRATLDVMTAARESGATVLAITSFPRSPAAELADIALVVAPINDSFRDELVHTSRAALMLVTESLVGLLVAQRGESARVAQSATLSVLGHSLSE